jgi:hypothetical protein
VVPGDRGIAFSSFWMNHIYHTPGDFRTGPAERSCPAASGKIPGEEAPSRSLISLPFFARSAIDPGFMPGQYFVELLI